LQCEALAGGLDFSPPMAKEQLTGMRKQLEEYIREARQAIWNLRSHTLQTCDLALALRETGLRATAGRSVEFTFNTTGTPRPCSPALQEALLRIGQEATLNAIRHAQPSAVRMSLQYRDDGVILRVSDNGCGFDVGAATQDTNGHYGLRGITERVSRCGGHLRIVSNVGLGTELEVIVAEVL
jgi:signal transduction histidine kinase